MNKVITFSLYGSDPKYCVGMIKNAELREETYSDWKIRVYLDESVPRRVVSDLERLGCEIVDMSDSKIPGMYWRFLAIEDPSIDVVCIRDSDSRLSMREKYAVNEWMNSDKILHIMRDHPHHGYPIMGGMWGYKNHEQPTCISLALFSFLSSRGAFKKMDDMDFISRLYYKNQGKFLVHDDWNRFNDAKPFPTGRDGKRFIGEIFDENDRPGPQCELL